MKFSKNLLIFFFDFFFLKFFNISYISYYGNIIGKDKYYDIVFKNYVYIFSLSFYFNFKDRDNNLDISIFSRVIFK